MVEVSAIEFGRVKVCRVPCSGISAVFEPIECRRADQQKDTAMSFTINTVCSQNKEQMRMEIAPLGLSPLHFNALELDHLIRQLSKIRAEMIPEQPTVASIPEIWQPTAMFTRWQVNDTNIAGHCLLWLLHPGVGWNYIILDRSTFNDMSVKLRAFLQEPARLQ